MYKMVRAFEMDPEELLGFNVKEISAGTSSGEGYTHRKHCVVGKDKGEGECARKLRSILEHSGRRSQKDWGGPLRDPVPISAGNREIKNGFEQE